LSIFLDVRLILNVVHSVEVLLLYIILANAQALNHFLPWWNEEVEKAVDHACNNIRNPIRRRHQHASLQGETRGSRKSQSRKRGPHQCIQCHPGNLLPTNVPKHLAGFILAPPLPYLVNALPKLSTPSVIPTKNGPNAGPIVCFCLGSNPTPKAINRRAKQKTNSVTKAFEGGTTSENRKQPPTLKSLDP
jgi:hypothetical protein